MANRKNTFLLKRSNVAGNVPVAGQIELGELALNTADVKLYASGTTTNSILQVGWDRVSRTGDTMTGTLYLPTISATTYQNLPTDIYVSGGTYNSGVATFTNTTGGTFNVSGFFTGGTPSVSFTQSSPSTGWTFTHNLGLERPMITVYNSNNQVIIPQEITALSTSTIYISFPVPISGYAIAGGGVIPQQTEEINIITSIIFG
jgi:hypothetical protein